MKGRISKQCRKQVKAVAKYIQTKGNSPEQASILIDTFNEKAASICKMPTIGTPYKNEIRKIPLGKFPYNIYYRITKDSVYFIGIWSMKRGKDFSTF